MKMFRKYSAAAAVGLAAMAFATTGLSGVFSASADAASTVVTVPYPTTDNLSSLDPIVWGGQVLVDQGTILEGLFGYNAKNQAIPAIADKWQSTDGGRVWTFWLRHNVKWSNGAPVTAQDFYYSWMRLISPIDTTGALWASVMLYVKNSSEYHSGAVPASAVGLKVVNNYELQLTLTGPHDILGDLPLAGSMPLYPPSVKAHPETWWMPKYFVGDGPYVVKSFVPNGEVVLTRNHRYSGSAKVGNVQQIDLIPAPTVPVEDFVANRLSTTLVTAASDYKYAEAHLKSELHVAPIAQINYLSWDKSDQASPLDNVAVRQAIAMAINRQPIAASVLSGMGAVTTTFGFPGWGPAKLEHGLPYNVAKARELLVKAGYPNGKGIPTLQIYSQTTANSPQSVLVAEAIASELHQALHLNFKIDPTNATLWGDINWDGENQGIQPGYNISMGVANWNDFTYLPLQSDTAVADYGSMGPVAFRQYAANHWYFPSYDPRDIKLWGNPTNTSLGVSYATWKPLIASATADISYLNAWDAKQPAKYRAYLQAPGSPSLSQQMQNFIDGWKTAKTSSAKHAAWEAFWKWVGTYSNGNGTASLGLNAQVYVDQHQPHDVYLWEMWQDELNNEVANVSVADHLTADMVNGLMQQGYVVPLYYSQAVYLTKSNLSGVQPNPFSLSGFYQLQNLDLH